MKFLGFDCLSSDETGSRYYSDNGAVVRECWGTEHRITPHEALVQLAEEIGALLFWEERGDPLAKSRREACERTANNIRAMEGQP